jgi:hypothetical protein
MPKATKAVVLARINNEVRQLFSIHERASGDLTIILKRGLRAETVGGNDKGTIQQRKIPVHRSPMSNTHNVVYTEIAGGSLTRAYSQFSPNKSYGNGIIWPVFAFRSTILPEDAYRPKVRPLDRTINIGNTPSSQWSLVVMIVVRDASMQLSKHWSFNHTTVSFSCFLIDVLWTYLKVPTTALGDYLFFATKQPLVDGRMQAGIEIINAKCPPPYRLLNLQDEALAWLSSNAIRKIVRLAREAGEIVSDEDEDELASRPIFLSGTMNG